MPRSMCLAAATAALLIVFGNGEASAGPRGCAQKVKPPAPAYTARYYGPAGYGFDGGRKWASGAVYRGPSAYVVYQPPYVTYSRPCNYFYTGLGSRRWLDTHGDGR